MPLERRLAGACMQSPYKVPVDPEHINWNTAQGHMHLQKNWGALQRAVV